MGEIRHETCFLTGEILGSLIMGVSTRNTMLAATVAIAMAGVAYAGGGMGSNGCNSGCGGANAPKGHGVMIPGATVGVPTVGQGGMMGKGQQVMVPGVNIAGANVRVSGPSIAVSGAGVSFGQSSFVDTRLNVVESTQRFDDRQFRQSGGFFSEPNPVLPSAIDGLFVEGNQETYTDTVVEQVPTTQTTCINQGGYTTALRPVQAFCIDDKGTPHPASRPSSTERVDANFEGEIFRCMAGTSMQVVLGDRSTLAGGSTNFQKASGFTCAKGQSLVHRRGGELVCQAQIPQRNCNERSLLRRNGPGIKLVQTRAPAACVPTTTTVMQSVTRQVERTRPVKTAPMVFDGGVGQSVH